MVQKPRRENGAETIETKRLILRKFNMDDVWAAYNNWCKDERVVRYCRWCAHENVSVTIDLIKGYVEEGYPYRWAIILKHTGELIGCIDLARVLDDGKTGEIGYMLSYDYWGKGIMTEALRAVINKLFEEGFRKIIARHAVPNLASGKVMQKCGMKYVGNCMGHRKYDSDEMIECCCYEIDNPSI